MAYTDTERPGGQSGRQAQNPPLDAEDIYRVFD